MSVLATPSVMRVRDALFVAGLGDRVIELPDDAGRGADAAGALGCEPGAIVKSLVFMIGKKPVLVLIAGDRTCRLPDVARTLRLEGKGRPASAIEVRSSTGFATGSVAPVGLTHRLPCAIDVSLKRFETLYAPAGHPNCVFRTSASELRRLTAGIFSYAIAEEGDAGAVKSRSA